MVSPKAVIGYYEQVLSCKQCKLKRDASLRNKKKEAAHCGHLLGSQRPVNSRAEVKKQKVKMCWVNLAGTSIVTSVRPNQSGTKGEVHTKDGANVLCGCNSVGHKDGRCSPTQHQNWIEHKQHASSLTSCECYDPEGCTSSW